MAAYAAAVSLMHILDLLKNHPSPPISLDKKQLHSLTEIVTLLQEFLEGYVSPFSYSDEADPLEIRIAEAFYAVEDVIESYIVDKIHHVAGPTHDTGGDNNNKNNNNDDNDDDDDDDDEVMEPAATSAHHDHEQICYIEFYEGLEKTIEAMDLIRKEAMGIVVNKGGLEAQLLRSVSVESRSKSSSNERMVGFEDELLHLKERLVGGDSNRQIIPIVGMGGIGKTTLARNLFADQLIKEHFDICVWVIISQDCNIKLVLSEVLGSEYSSDKSVAELGEEVHKYLFDKRYLVIMDDMWNLEVWDKMRFFFPDCRKRSRVIVTSRMSNMASHLANSDNILCLSFLNEVDSWNLFTKTVFGREESSSSLELELREIGEKIVGKCKGLPLSIVAIGGLLARSERTKGFWEYIEENLSSIVNLENEEYCLRVLKLSYIHLPAYLKPCFLYMGVFDEDSEITVSSIINLWVSEGFVRPKRGKKNLETVGREYFQELVDRNLLIAVDSKYRAVEDRELGSVGLTKQCRMHDLVRDVSLREAQKQRFYYVYSKLNPSSHGNRRMVIPDSTWDADGLECSPHDLRTYICHDDHLDLFPDFKLLRTLHKAHRRYSLRYEYEHEDVFRFVNLRLLAVAVTRWPDTLCSSISRLWSLHTLLVFCNDDLQGPVEFWKMHQLKHVEFTCGRLILQVPPRDDGNTVIMEDLHTLIGVKDLHLNEDVVKRIPNVRILDVNYKDKRNIQVHNVSHLHCLSKLESFRCSIEVRSSHRLERIRFPHSLEQISFPLSLKQIALIDSASTHIELEHVLQKIGCLPLLQDLTVSGGFFEGGVWETTKGQFPRLESLELISCRHLKSWMVSESSHFPVVEMIRLEGLQELEGIPSEIGEMAMLHSVELDRCSESAVLSAKAMVEEQVDLLGEEDVSFWVQARVENEELQSLTAPNFRVFV